MSRTDTGLYKGPVTGLQLIAVDLYCGPIHQMVGGQQGEGFAKFALVLSYPETLLLGPLPSLSHERVPVQ